MSAASAPVNNRITGYTVKSDSRYTTLTLDTEQQVSYTMRYSADAVTIQFHYTNSLPDSMTLSRNPLFSEATFSGDTLTLTLRNQARFMGCAPFYKNGKLVLRFNNPPSSVANAKIVIDPGHGGNDSGRSAISPPIRKRRSTMASPPDLPIFSRHAVRML